MNTKLVTSNFRIQQWAEIIQDRARSGLKVDEYCETHNLTHHQYYYWLKKVREAAITAAPDQVCTGGFVEISPVQKPDVSAYEQPEVSATAAVISIGRCDIKLSNAASEEFISHVLGAVLHAQ